MISVSRLIVEGADGALTEEMRRPMEIVCCARVMAAGNWCISFLERMQMRLKE